MGANITSEENNSEDEKKYEPLYSTLHLSSNDKSGYLCLPSDDDKRNFDFINKKKEFLQEELNNINRIKKGVDKKYAFHFARKCKLNDLLEKYEFSQHYLENNLRRNIFKELLKIHSDTIINYLRRAFFIDDDTSFKTFLTYYNIENNELFKSKDIQDQIVSLLEQVSFSLAPSEGGLHFNLIVELIFIIYSTILKSVNELKDKRLFYITDDDKKTMFEFFYFIYVEQLIFLWHTTAKNSYFSRQNQDKLGTLYAIKEKKEYDRLQKLKEDENVDDGYYYEVQNEYKLTSSLFLMKQEELENLLTKTYTKENDESDFVINMEEKKKELEKLLFK